MSTEEDEDAEVTREEHGALKWAALLAAVAIVWLIVPIGVGILIGMLLAFVMQPLYGRIKPRFGASWAAFSIALGATLALAGAAVAVVWMLVGKGMSLAREPHEINVAAVVRLTEPHHNLVECFDARTNTCPIDPACGLKQALLRAQEAFFAELEKYSLADFTARGPALIKLWQRNLKEVPA